MFTKNPYIGIGIMAFILTPLAHASALEGQIVGASQISLQGGSHSSVQWQVPAASTFRLWVHIPSGSTATQARYRLYFKGNRANDTTCVATDTAYPCVEITVNQAAHQKQWLPLLKGTQQEWTFTQKGFVSINAKNINSNQQLGVNGISFEDRVFTPGKTYGGGIIFYVDHTRKHGLIAAEQDQSTGLQWYNGIYGDTNAFKTAVGTGKNNTATIMKQQGTGFYAASLCDRLVIDKYKDWFLPSKDELALMYKNIGPGAANALKNKGNFAARIYWSSSEVDNQSAWYQSFTDGKQDSYDKYGGFYVRAIRAF